MAETRSSSRRLLLVSLLVLTVVATAALHGKDVAPAVPDATDRCPVCGMLVEPHQDWLAQVRLADGTTLFFEGARDMFTYLLDRDRYAKEKRDVEIVGGFVTSYSDHRAIPIDDAWFVIGSDVMGPAGSDLVPLPTLQRANEFILEHGGMRLLRADRVTPELLAQMP